MRKVIISVAPVEAGAPIDKEALVEDVAECAKKGAAMCHLHCRSLDGRLTKDTGELEDIFDRIAKRTDLICQVSTGGVSDMSIEERCRPLRYPGAESASLNAGSTNLGEAVYINSFADIRYCAQEVYSRGIVPEIEVFDIGMIYNIRLTKEQVLYREPVIYNLVFGHKGGLPANMECLTAFRAAVPKDALWGVTHFQRDNWEFLAAAIAMGASIVRIGFEDSAHLAGGRRAAFNHQLTEKLVRMLRAMDLEAASPQEARGIMNISSLRGRREHERV